jgi:hypothetical protein
MAEEKKQKEYLKAWHLAHPNYEKEWLEKNPGYGKAWRENHPWKCLECGVPTYYRHKYCPAHKAVGSRNGNWKGGRRNQSDGYVMVYSPNHPCADVNKTVYEHRLVMEEKMGRILFPEEIVHHINGLRDDNRIENLMLFPNHAEHRKHHAAMNGSRERVDV